jgi:anti-anti-sigma regulatory factor
MRCHLHNGAIMPSEVQHLVDTGGWYPVIQLTGVLDTDTATAVRWALVELLAQQPEAIVIDVSDLQLPDPAAISVLRDVAKETADWPAAHLVLCAPTSDPWHTTGLPVWRSTADAFTDLGEPDSPRQLSLELEPVVGAARRSRELVTEACGRWDQPGLAGPACIVVTEMVNNVVTHARTPMIVLLAIRPDAMAVAVRDRSSTVPQFTGPVPATSYGGRGMLLIDSVADRWGSLPLEAGKVVWALLQQPDERPPAQLRHRNAGMADRTRG